MTATASHRERLPNRRQGETFDIECAGLRYTCTIGRFRDGRIAEIFLSNHKSNSAADTAATAIVASIALQFGANVETIRRALCRDSRGHASGPLGGTGRTGAGIVMTAAQLTRALGGRWHGRYGTARCLVHDDRSPSLSIVDGNEGPVV